MKKRRKNMTRSELAKSGPRNPSSKSKYALKTAKRRRLAQSLGLPDNTPFPAIWAYQERIKR